MTEISYIHPYEVKKVKKIDTGNENYDNFFITDKVKSRKILFSLYNFNKMPPIIGIILANNAGTSILNYQYDSANRNGYGEIDTYLNGSQDCLLDFITMCFSSLNTFADNVNIENLRYVGIGGSNIKIKVFFKFETFMIIVFLNSNTDLSINIQDHILEHFREISRTCKEAIENYNNSESRRIRKDLETAGEKWIIKLNKLYIKAYEKLFFAKDERCENLMGHIKPIVNETLGYYLKHIPEEIKTDICREIYEKIDDKLSKYF